MCVQKECRDQIIERKILAPKILEPLVLAHDVDQKLVKSLIFHHFLDRNSSHSDVI